MKKNLRNEPLWMIVSNGHMMVDNEELTYKDIDEKELEDLKSKMKLIKRSYERSKKEESSESYAEYYILNTDDLNEEELLYTLNAIFYYQGYTMINGDFEAPTLKDIAETIAIKPETLKRASKMFSKFDVSDKVFYTVMVFSVLIVIMTIIILCIK